MASVLALSPLSTMTAGSSFLGVPSHTTLPASIDRDRKERKKKLRLEMSQFLQLHTKQQKPLETNNLTLENIGKPIHDFTAHVQELSKTCKNCREGYDGFDFEFEELRKLDAVVGCASATTACLPHNKPKNRYRNILPNEHTRVKLDCKVDADECCGPNDTQRHDYINANWIHGRDFGVANRTYIATQAPLASTFCDFWSMSWQNKCSCIVVLSSESEIVRGKIDQYWPEIDCEGLMFGEITVRCLKEWNPTSEIIQRTLCLTKGEETRTMTLVQFTGWPDQGVPTSQSCVFDLLSLMEPHREGPIIVHCSAGVGRTGALICVDILFSRMKSFVACGGKVFEFNVFETVKKLKASRTGMVQQKEQYIFCHKAILEAAVSMGLSTPLPSSFSFSSS